MSLGEISEKGFFISRNKLKERRSLFFEKSPFFSTWTLTRKFFIQKLLNFSGPTKISIDEFDGDTNMFSTKILNMATNIISIDNAPLINSYPPQFGVIISYEQEGGKIGYSAGRSLESTQVAFNKAFGEYLERYHGCYSSSSFRSYFFSSSDSSIRIEQLPHPLSEQIIMKSFPLKEKDLNFLKACYTLNVTKNKKELVPLQCLFYNVREEPYFLQHQTSSGGGGGYTREKAKLSAVYELIERDNFLLFWLSGIAPKQINIGSLPNSLKEYLKKVSHRYKLNISVLDISCDIPVFSCAVSIVDNIDNRVAVGTASGKTSSASDIILKAFSEALVELHSSSPSFLTEDDYKQYQAFSDKDITKETRKNFYNSKAGVNLFKNLFLTGDIVQFPISFDKEASLPREELIRIEDFFRNQTEIKGDGYNLYFYKYESSLLSKFDYFVYRAYIPSLMKIWLRENMATPWSDRLVGFALDHGKVSFSQKDINIYPHPLA